MSDDLWPEDETLWDAAYTPPREDVLRAGFRAYVARHNPGLLRYEHVPQLCDVVDRLVAGTIMRLMVLLPPRYFKTEIFSRLLSGYFLRCFPTRHVGIVSYGAELAWDISGEARTYYTEDGGVLRADSQAKKRWKNPAGGQLWAAGVGGPMLGFGYHLGIVDDPTDPEKAHSPAYQKRFNEWLPGKFLSRQEPEARVVVVMQRLGVDDPIDLLFRREVGEDTEEAPEHWHVVCCEERYTGGLLGRWSGPRGLPPTCTLEPDPRKPGDVLAPSRFSPADVDRLQRSAGFYVCAAQRQQSPAMPKGDFWQEDWFEVYDDLPDDAHNGGWDWDCAYTEDDANSASAGVKSYRGRAPADRPRDYPVYIDDVAWDWMEFPELLGFIRDRSGPHYVEAKASGKSVRQVLKREGIAAKEVQVKGDKFARASAVQAMAATGRVRVRRVVLRKLLLAERQGLLRVTAETLVAGGPDLDVNDAFVQALHRHGGVGARKVRIYYPGAKVAS